MLSLIALGAFILAVAYMNVQWIARTEKNRNRNIIWFFIALIDILGTIIAIKVYNLLRNGIDLEFAGAANYFFLILGGASLFLISNSLLSVLSRHGAYRQGAGLVFLLDFLMAIVIFGLFLL